MTRSLRRFLWIGGGLLAALALLAIVVPLLVDLNRYHDPIEARAEKLLGRDVTLGTMKLSFFPVPGVSVEPLVIASDRSGDPPLLRVESLSARVKLLPLLRREISVESIVARAPQINLHRYPDGRFNLPSLAASASAEPAGTSSPADAGLRLAKLRIEGATLRLVDEAVLPGQTITTALDGFDLALDDYAPGQPFSMKIRTGLPPDGKGSVAAEATIALPPDSSRARERGVEDRAAARGLAAIGVRSVLRRRGRHRAAARQHLRNDSGRGKARAR